MDGSAVDGSAADGSAADGSAADGSAMTRCNGGMCIPKFLLEVFWGVGESAGRVKYHMDL